MPRDKVHESVRIAAAPTLERIRRDREQASSRLVALLRFVEKHLFEAKLTADAAWAGAGIRDHSLQGEFRSHTGTSLARYIEAARLDVAGRLLRDGEIEISVIYLELGYTYHPTFCSAYKRHTGRTPSQTRRAALAARRAGPSTEVADPLSGNLAGDEAQTYLRRFLAAYPELDPPAENRRTVVDGAQFEQLHAEQLWRRIRALPTADQRREVRGYLFCSPVFFDLLRRKSREEGRRDRQRGIDLAELAIVSLEASDEAHGDKIHDLRALGWAWLGNAYRLAMDFAGAEAAFEKCDGELYYPRHEVNERILGTCYRLKGALRISQRRYDEALEQIERAQHLSSAGGDSKSVARALIQMASIHGYTNHLDEAIVALGSAQDVLKDQPDPHLAVAISANLANLLARTSQYELAAAKLRIAFEQYALVKDPVSGLQIQWVEGNIRHGQGNRKAAESLYRTASAGFEELGQTLCSALTNLDLAILHTNHQEWGKACLVAGRIVPILESLNLYPETVAAVGLLSKTVQARQLTQETLQTVRSSLNADPLASLTFLK